MLIIPINALDEGLGAKPERVRTAGIVLGALRNW